jgi:antigen flippase
VPQLVRAQIISDVGGAIVFAALVPALGLPGSILGFATTHLLFYLITAFSVRKTLGSAYVRPRPSAFSWALVRSNLGFGASGLAMIALSNLSVVVVSRLVIDHLGIGSSGIFSNAWRIASVYLGAVTTTAISYYLPTLTRATSDEQMSRDVNATIRFYLYLLPLIMAAIMAAGEPIVWLILSAKFLPVAPLLLLFVPAELMRILSETAGMPLLARRRLGPFTALFAFQTTIFVGGAALALPHFGLAGAAGAYGLATTLSAAVTFVTCRFHTRLKFEPRTALSLARAIALLGVAMGAGFSFPFGVMRLIIIGVAGLAWLSWTLTDDGAVETLSRLKPRLFRPQ